MNRRLTRAVFQRGSDAMQFVDANVFLRFRDAQTIRSKAEPSQSELLRTGRGRRV